VGGNKLQLKDFQTEFVAFGFSTKVLPQVKYTKYHEDVDER